MRARFPALVAVSGPTAGFLAVGMSGFALLAAGPRLLGATQYALMAVAWTLANVIGIGLAMPGEQAVSRATAIGQQGDIATRVRRRLLIVTLGAAALPLAGLVGADPVLSGSQVWAWSVVLAASGWALAAPARGALAGRGEFHAYAWSLSSEAITRVALVGLAWLEIGPSDLLLAASLGVPLLVSAVVAHLARSPSDSSAAAGSTMTDSDQFWYTAVAFSTQVSLGLPAVVLQVVSPDSGVAGTFVTASVYMRIPITFIGGLLVVVLSRVALYHGSGRTQVAARVAGKALVATLFIGLLGGLALWLVSDFALRILYGEDLQVSKNTLAVMALSTVAAMAAGILTQTLFGFARSRPVALVWMTVAVGVATSALFAPGTATAMAVAILVGQLLAVAGGGVLLLLVLRESPVSEGLNP